MFVGEVKFVAHHLAECGAGALAAIGFANEESGGVVGMNDDPGIELQKVRVGIGASGCLRQHARAGHSAKPEAQHQRAGGRQKVAA